MTFQACDVRDRAALEALFKSVAPFDILVSAATGGDRALGPFLSMDMDGYKASFDKMWGYANVVRYGTGHMAKDGTIVWSVVHRHVKPSPARSRSARSAVRSRPSCGQSRPSWRRAGVQYGVAGHIDTPMVPLKGEERTALYVKMVADNVIPRAGTADEVAQGSCSRSRTISSPAPPSMSTVAVLS
ncbi:MAG: SDR family NAD(P)-dependent oxidoreductase [Burkholderiaceae bacterium]